MAVAEREEYSKDTLPQLFLQLLRHFLELSSYERFSPINYKSVKLIQIFSNSC